jgi:hypothetical protein
MSRCVPKAEVAAEKEPYDVVLAAERDNAAFAAGDAAFLAARGDGALAEAGCAACPGAARPLWAGLRWSRM